MKNLKILILCLFITGGANVHSVASTPHIYAVVVDSTNTKPTPVNCPCDKKMKRAKKRNGQARTKAGQVIWEILHVLKELAPFIGLIAK